MQSWKLIHATKERVREKKGTEQSVLKTGIMQQQQMKEGNKNTLSGKKKEKKDGRRKERREWHKMKVHWRKSKEKLYHSR